MTKRSFFQLTRLGVALTLMVPVSAQGATYHRTSSLSGNTFLDAFQWMAITDPTHGDVNYVNQSTARADGLYSVNGNSVTLRADDTTILSGTGPGRNSFRLQSNEQYTTHVAMQVFDIAHMPEGCGTWPAVWFEYGADWPNEGEIDIVEGVNNQTPNESTLHTGANCTMPVKRQMTGHSLGNDCDVYEADNKGCPVAFADNNSYGPNFNANGGGWYAIERSSTYISIYFWQRDCRTVPNEVSSPGDSVNTSTWGEPAAHFPSTNCDFSTHLGPHNIVIDLTFCGDWAGNSTVYAASGCPSTCTDFVNNNPGAFSKAYFKFNALNIYK